MKYLKNKDMTDNIQFSSILLLIISLLLSCSKNQIEDRALSDQYIVPEVKNELVKQEDADKNSFANSNYYEQISCNPNDCVEVKYDEYSELDEKLESLLDRNAGKVLIQMKSYALKLSSEELEDVVPYLREIAKNDGQVSMEPLYIGQREFSSLGIPFVKDAGLVGYSIFKRISNYVKYKSTQNYNAKIIYHPVYQTVYMIFIVHKSYGDVCNTIYSNCRDLEYIDDETFDHTLSRAIKESITDKKPVRVNFSQLDVKLMDTKLDLDNLKEMNKASRLYKWLVITKKTEKKPVVRQRFMGIQAAVTLIDYSLTLYDTIKAIQLYNPALQTIAEVSYTGEEKGGKIQSVTFRIAEEGEIQEEK